MPLLHRVPLPYRFAVPPSSFLLSDVVPRYHLVRLCVYSFVAAERCFLLFLVTCRCSARPRSGVFA